MIDQTVKVLWVTGLSGAGKSTLSHEIVKQLRLQGPPVVLLDGDELREVFGTTVPGTSAHDRDARIELAFKYSRLSKLMANQGLTVVVATISMFKEVHDWNRKNLPGYIEIFLKVPTDELRRRDPKGIYRRFDNGEINNVAGLDLEVDEPEQPEIVFEFNPNRNVIEMCREVLNFIYKRK